MDEVAVKSRYTFLVVDVDDPHTIQFELAYGQNAQGQYYLQLYNKITGTLIINFVALNGDVLASLLARFGCKREDHIRQARAGLSLS